MDILTTEYAGNAVWRWGVGLLVVFLGTLVLRFVRRLIVRRFGALADRTETLVDNLVIDLVGKTKTITLIVLMLALAAAIVALPEGLTLAIRVIAIVMLVVQGGIWANEALVTGLREAMRRRQVEDPERDSQADVATFTLFRFVGRLLVWSLVVLLCLANLGVNISAAVAGLGVAGIAVALAVQTVLGDLFASFSILLDQPFVVGDFVDIGPQLGSIEKIGLKTTRVRSLTGEQLIVSNTDLLSTRIRNYGRMQERRIGFAVGVLYQTSYEHLAAIPTMIREIVEGVEGTRFDRAHFKGFGAYALDFEIVYYAQTPDYVAFMDIQQAINLAIVQRFADEGIEFAYPTQTLHLSGQWPSASQPPV